MESLAPTEEIQIEVRLPADGTRAALIHDVREGLSRDLKELPPKYFYDELGSELFEQITELAEYYPTAAERAILRSQSDSIVAAADPECLIELGSGSAAKTRTLLDAMRDRGSLHTYVPVDISEQITRRTAVELIDEYPGMNVHGVICDFESQLEALPGWGRRRMFAFLGGTIGNFPPARRTEFLARIAALLGPEDSLLLGTDLIKDRARLEAAYDDAAGVTAKFNKNVLAVLNRELGADFNLDRFEHVAFYDERNEWVDIRLRSLVEQEVSIANLEMTVRFSAGEEMRTEISAKFSPDGLARNYAEAGLHMAELWTDPEHLFALSLARPG